VPSFGIYEQPGAVTLVANSGQMPSTVAAGAVVEVRGNHADEIITCNGTAVSPAFIVGGAGVNITGEWRIQGGYCILDQLRFTGSHEVYLAGHHQAVRNSESIGILSEGPSSAVSAGSGASDVVFYNNRVHDHGNVAASNDQDANCISIAAGTTRAWIVDNETYRCSGDGINVNPYPYDTANRASIKFVYIGRNKSHDNKQTGIWAKMSQDIVVSQNEVWNHRPGNSSYGQCVGFQYGTERAWYLFNLIHDCNVGIGIAGDLGGADGQQTYMIGNVIYNISGSSGGSGVWADAAIQITGGTNHTVVNNTLSNVSSGVHVTRAATVLLSGNIFADVASAGDHFRLEGPSAIANTSLSNVAWRGDATCSACIVGPPGFVSPGHDFRLQSGSLAIDRGAQNPVYSTFYTLYGIDVSFDAARSSRPRGANWDIGAYEYP
jgi:hypothetical protein